MKSLRLALVAIVVAGLLAGAWYWYSRRASLPPASEPIGFSETAYPREQAQPPSRLELGVRGLVDRVGDIRTAYRKGRNAEVVLGFGDSLAWAEAVQYAPGHKRQLLKFGSIGSLSVKDLSAHQRRVLAEIYLIVGRAFENLEKAEVKDAIVDNYGRELYDPQRGSKHAFREAKLYWAQHHYRRGLTFLHGLPPGSADHGLLLRLHLVATYQRHRKHYSDEDFQPAYRLAREAIALAREEHYGDPRVQDAAQLLQPEELPESYRRWVASRESSAPAGATD